MIIGHDSHDPLLFVHLNPAASYMCVLPMAHTPCHRRLRATETRVEGCWLDNTRRAMEKRWLLGIRSVSATSDSAVAHARPVQRIEQLHLPYPATSCRHFPAYYGPRRIAASGKELFNEILRRENPPLDLARSEK